MMLLGAYVGGGTAVTCSRSRLMPPVSESVDGSRPPLVAECRVETRRWLARKIVAERTYLRITKADSIAVSRTETSKDANGNRTTRTVEDWSLQLFDGDNEIERIGATREQVEYEKAKLIAWFEKGGADPVHLSFSQWAFAIGSGGFGLTWLIITTLIARFVTGSGSYAWRRDETADRWSRRRSRRGRGAGTA
jgi:hypothetical protein